MPLSLTLSSYSINSVYPFIVLFSTDWVDEIDLKWRRAQGIDQNLTSSKHSSSILERGFNYLCNMSIDHYVLVTSLTSTNGQVECEFTTWGKKYTCNLRQNEFLNSYRGAVIANAEKFSQDNKVPCVSGSTRNTSFPCKRRLKAD